MTESREPRLADFWQGRARTAFWPTREIGYRIGSVLALVACRAGLTPNAVSILSLASVSAGLAAALLLFDGVFAQGCSIFFVLMFSYSLDCADGLLARVGAMGSRFGAFFDKYIDVLVQALIVGVLGSVAGGEQSWLVTLPAAAGVAFALGVRLSLCVLLWLKEFEASLPQRVVEDERRRDLGWWFRRSAGFLSDQVTYIVVISVAWAGGVFWDALWIYHGLIALLSIGYLGSLYREKG